MPTAPRRACYNQRQHPCAMNLAQGCWRGGFWNNPEKCIRKAAHYHN